MCSISMGMGMLRFIPLLHFVLFLVSLILLINLKTSWINKILWTITMFFFLFIGSVSFLIWRRYELKKQEEHDCGSDKN